MLWHFFITWTYVVYGHSETCVTSRQQRCETLTFDNITLGTLSDGMPHNHYNGFSFERNDASWSDRRILVIDTEYMPQMGAFTSIARSKPNIITTSHDTMIIRSNNGSRFGVHSVYMLAMVSPLKMRVAWTNTDSIVVSLVHGVWTHVLINQSNIEWLTMGCASHEINECNIVLYDDLVMCTNE